MIGRIDVHSVSEQTLRSRVTYCKLRLENTMLPPLTSSGSSVRAPPSLIYDDFQPLAQQSSLTITHKILWTPVFVFRALHVNPH